MKEIIACLGAGRMGRGIAVVFAYAGHHVTLVDFKPRDEATFRKLSDDALSEVRNTLATLAGFGMFEAAAVDTLMTRVSVVPESAAQGISQRPAPLPHAALSSCTPMAATRSPHLRLIIRMPRKRAGSASMTPPLKTTRPRLEMAAASTTLST